jgi:(E)-4-hydroxy-3-methyl-but-2-enyl pyrophosphate reductase
MTIILARTAGFCYGVRRAITLALSQAHKDEGRLVTIGPLVHNQQAIDLLKSRSISTISNVEDLRKEDRVLIRAHGITPALRKKLKEKCTEICDATCPHVTASQRIVEHHANQGYACLIVGDRGHAEVEGLLGCASGKGVVIENEKDLENLTLSDRICVVAQTTQDMEHYKKIVNLIKERFGEVVIFETICQATSQRQKELMEIAGKSDVVVIVGGKASANTRRLVEMARSIGPRTFHVETAEELKLEEINPRDVIGVTAGASTPHWVIRNVVETLADYQLQKRFFLFRFLVGSLRFLIYSSIFLAFGGGFLTYTAAHLMGLHDYHLNILLAFFFILSMHLINKRLSLQRDENLLYGSQKRFARYKDAFTILALFCIAFSLLIAFYIGYSGIFLQPDDPAPEDVHIVAKSTFDGYPRFQGHLHGIGVGYGGCLYPLHVQHGKKHVGFFLRFRPGGDPCFSPLHTSGCQRPGGRYCPGQGNHSHCFGIQDKPDHDTFHDGDNRHNTGLRLDFKGFTHVFPSSCHPPALSASSLSDQQQASPLPEPFLRWISGRTVFSFRNGSFSLGYVFQRIIRDINLAENQDIISWKNWRMILNTPQEK